MQGRAQVTRVGASVSTPLYLNGGIPQGTKLGPVLFAVMVNDLVQSWNARLLFLNQHWKNKKLCKRKRFIKLLKQTGAREGVGKKKAKKYLDTSIKNILKLILRFFH